MKEHLSRYDLIDTFHGLTLFSIVLYHLSWSLVHLWHMDWQRYRSDWAYLWQQTICWGIRGRGTTVVPPLLVNALFEERDTPIIATIMDSFNEISIPQPTNSGDAFSGMIAGAIRDGTDSYLTFW